MFNSYVKMQPNLCSLKLWEHFGEIRHYVLNGSKDVMC